MSNKVIFFDIDGTLLNTGGAGQLAMERALVHDFRINFPFEGVLTAGRTDRGITDEIFDRYEVENTLENRERFREAYLSHLPNTLAAAPGLLLPGVVELLKELETDESVVLSILTGNYLKGAEIKLRHFTLSEFFVSGGFGDHHADRNDVARLAMGAIKKHLDREVDATDTMVIGDTPADITCARAIGATAVAVATGKFSVEELSAHNPDHLFPDFTDTTGTRKRILELL